MTDLDNSWFGGFWNRNMQRRLIKQGEPVKDDDGQSWATWEYRSLWNPAQLAWAIRNRIVRLELPLWLKH